MMNAQRKYKTALDEYINKVYVLILLIVPGACQCAGLLYTTEKIFGLFPTVSWTALIIFDITCLLYLFIGIYFVYDTINGVLGICFIVCNCCSIFCRCENCCYNSFRDYTFFSSIMVCKRTRIASC